MADFLSARLSELTRSVAYNSNDPEAVVKLYIVLGDSAVVVTGFYEFTRMQEGKPVPGPSRFTMVITRSGDEWRIAHHHSSPRVPPKQ